MGQLSGGDRVTGAHLVAETQALLVDQDSAVAPEALGDQGGGLLLHSGVDLDLVHVHGGGADSLSHLNAVTGAAGGVGGDKAIQRGLQLSYHLQVGAEAAGGQDHALGIDGETGGGCLYTHSLAVLHDDLIHGGVKDDLHPGILASLLQDGHDVGTHIGLLTGVILGPMDAVDAGAAKGTHIVQVGTDALQPLHTGGGVLGQHGDQVQIIDALAAHHSVQDHQVDRVKVALGAGGFPVVILLLNGGHKVLQLRIGGSGGGEGLLQTGALLELIVVLIGGIGSIHTAGRLGGVAAHQAQLLYQDHLLAGLGGGDGGGHAGAAGAHHHNVSVLGAGGVGIGVGAAGDQGGGVHAGGLQRSLHGLDDALAGVSGGGDGVHLGGLDLHDLGGDLLNGGSADARGLAVLGDLDLLDPGGGQGHADFDDAAKALTLAGVGTGLKAAGGGGGKVGDVHQLGGVGGVLVPLHLDAQQLAEIAQGDIGGAVIGEHLGGLTVGLGRGDLLTIDGHVHGSDRDGFLRAGGQSHRTQDHENGQRQGSDAFFHRFSLLIRILWDSFNEQGSLYILFSSL